MRLLPALNVRLPAELRRALEDACADSGRSLNAEIVWRLRQSFQGWKQ